MSTQATSHPSEAEGFAETKLSPVQRTMDWLGNSPSTAAVREVGMRTIRVTYRSPWFVLPHRLDLPLLLNSRRLTGCGAEVGVKQGEYSEVLLESWRGRHLISIDPWLAAPEPDYLDIANVTQATHDSFYEETASRLSRFGPRSTIWRMMGDEGAEQIPHHSLDFVYLDARHDRASVLQDLRPWTEKVRPGGIVAGHDYLDGTFAEGEFGVKSAVDEFFTRKGWRVRATFADPPCVSWYVLAR